jgi:MurNAc alpha-1-phosphate uridylyltransferase
MKAMLLAAGLGMRMRPLTLNVPKALLPLGGKPMIDHHIERLVAAGITELVINVSWLGEQIEGHCGDGARYGARIRYSREPGAPLETGGGIRRALPLLGEDPFLLVAADVWCPYPFAPFAQNALAPGVHARLVVVPNPPQHPRGDFRLRPDGLLTSDADGEPCTYSCIALIAPQLLAGFDAEVFPLVQPLRKAAAAEALAGEWWRGEWEDVGTPERYAALQQRLCGG